MTNHELQRLSPVSATACVSGTNTPFKVPSLCPFHINLRSLDDMEPGTPSETAFYSACIDGDLRKIRKVLANGLPTRTLEHGLSLATGAAHPDVVDAGAPMTAFAIDALGGRDGEQHPDVVRHYLNRGLNPNHTTSDREPLLR